MLVSKGCSSRDILAQHYIGAVNGDTLRAQVPQSFLEVFTRNHPFITGVDCFYLWNFLWRLYQ
jgi:hypothetical protein